MRIRSQVGEGFVEEAVDPARLARAIEEERADLQRLRERLQEKPNELDRTRLGRVLQRLGRHLELKGAHDRAAECCEEAAEIWSEFGRERARYLVRLRRAEIELARGCEDRALERVDALVAAAEEAPFEIYRDFALELRGRVRARRGDDDPARRNLREAARIRRRRGRERLLERTERLLERLDGS